MQVLEQREPLRNSNSNEKKLQNYETNSVDINNNNKSESSEIQQSIPGVSQLLPSLYLCGASVLSSNLITQLGINFVINVSAELPDTPLPANADTLYLRISISDRPNAELSKHFDEVADMIEEVRLSGGKTLVHCVAGVSRSASLCLAYLMKCSGMTLKEAFVHVKNIRPQIRPNTGFFQQLRCYEEQRYGSQSVQMLFLECLQREIPDVYESEFRPMEEFYRRHRHVSRRNEPLTT
ncbi:dual specificity protein phosphatase 18 [Haematobia irritans]|uniref:dual specificity protein phosphatase 18 n=1 Tax=Haematobia irritans TaxID=7368 RepID=UPI003F508939